MATENAKFNTRIQLKHDTEANWAKAANFIPKLGEFVIYDADAFNPTRFKIGDGSKVVSELPFFGSNEKALPILSSYYNKTEMNSLLDEKGSKPVYLECGMIKVDGIFQIIIPNTTIDELSALSQEAPIKILAMLQEDENMALGILDYIGETAVGTIIEFGEEEFFYSYAPVELHDGEDGNVIGYVLPTQPKFKEKEQTPLYIIPTRFLDTPFEEQEISFATIKEEGFVQVSLEEIEEAFISGREIIMAQADETVGVHYYGVFTTNFILSAIRNQVIFQGMVWQEADPENPEVQSKGWQPKTLVSNNDGTWTLTNSWWEGYAKTEDLEGAIAALQRYTDNSVAALVDSAPEKLNTLGELAAALKNNENIVDVLQQSIGNKIGANHTHKASYTPAGSVSKPTFTGTEVTTSSISGTGNAATHDHKHEVTAAGSVSQPTFTGTAGTATASYTPAGSVSQPTFTGTEATVSAEYTPAGSVTQPSFTGSKGTTSSISGTQDVYSITGVGTPSTMSASVSNKCLTLTFTEGSAATRSSAISVSTGAHTHEFTPSGTVSKPTFSGTKANISTKYTPAGTVSKPTFSGTLATINASYTPSGTVSKPTFTGTKVDSGAASASISVATGTHTHKVTASGNVSQPTFTGTTANISTDQATVVQ